MKKFVILLFCTMYLTPALIAQPVHTPVRYIDYYGKHKGYIILNDDSKIFGYFQYATYEFPTFNLKCFDNANKLKKRYKFSKIKLIKLSGNDPVLSSADSIMFIKLFEKEEILYRQLTTGDIQIYDQLFLVDEKPGTIGKSFVVIVGDKKYIAKNEEALLSLVQKLNPTYINQGSNLKVEIKSMIQRINKVR